MQPAELEKPDERTLERLRKSALNLKCEFVVFDEALVKGLFQSLRSGQTPLHAVSVSFRLTQDRYSVFSGTYYYEPEDTTSRGPYEWIGRILDEPKSFAQFIQRRDGRIEAHISSSHGVYTLSPSTWSENYFFCKRDPEFRQKID